MDTRPRVEHQDWIHWPTRLPERSVDFLYADPPFNTGKSQKSPARGNLLHRATDLHYADDFGDSTTFLNWLRPRVAATLPLLKPSALLALHVDWRSSHRVRVMLDELLGETHFVNHLVWSYGLGGSSPRRFARKHDDILLYAIDPLAYFFDPPMIPATSVRMRGQMKKATDILDIPAINNMARERTGYPTQKPLALLDVLIRACCPVGGVVLDPCCGSGTTLLAASLAGRIAIGGDISPDAVQITRDRLLAPHSSPNTPGVHSVGCSTASQPSIADASSTST